LLASFRIGGITFYPIIGRPGVYFRYVTDEFVGVALTSKNTINIKQGVYFHSNQWYKKREISKFDVQNILKWLSKMIDRTVKPPDLNDLVFPPSSSFEVVKKKKAFPSLSPQFHPIIIDEREYKNKKLEDIHLVTRRNGVKESVGCRYIVIYIYIFFLNIILSIYC
jgi:hypothetical protein